MAFGDKTKQYKDTAKSGGNSTGVDGERKIYDSQWMPAGSGKRIFRPLQEVKDGKLVMAERKNASGKLIYEGGKKTGKPMLGPIPAEETIFMFAWWEVMVNGNKTSRRLMLDPMAGGDPNKAKFRNPLWEFIADNYPQGSQQRNAIKNTFAMHVWDMTPVMRNDEGVLFYPAEDETWRLQAYGQNGKLIDPKAKGVKLPEHWNADPEEALENEWATPRNKVVIFEGSYGKPAKEGGKHLFAQFEQIVGTVEDGNGVIRNLGEFDMLLNVTGEGKDTQRAIRALNRFQPLPDEANFAARYDLALYTTPWPDEAIQRLIELEDYNEIVTEFQLEQYPQLIEQVEESDADLKAQVREPSKEEDGLFDD